MGTDTSPSARDPARMFGGRVVPLFLGAGLVIAGVSYLFMIAPDIAFGVLLILLGSALFSTYR